MTWLQPIRKCPKCGVSARHSIRYVEYPSYMFLAAQQQWHKRLGHTFGESLEHTCTTCDYKTVTDCADATA